MKKNPIIRTLAVLFALMLTIGTVFANPSDTYAATKKPTKITLSATSATIGVGAKTTIKVKKVTPSGASKTVTYKSSNKKVATVSKKGVVTGKKAGTATITVTSTKAKKVTAKFKVTVKKLTGVTASGSVSNTVVVAKGKTLTLTPAPTPAELTDGTVSYKIVKKAGVSTAKSKKVISLNKKTGKIKAKKAGTAYVQITYKVGKTTKKQTIKVVVPSKKVTSLSIKASKKTLEIGQTATITPTVKPATATCKLVSYTSSKPSVATVNSKGKVTAKAAGTTTITVKTLDGNKKKTVKITVKKAATSVTISGSSSVQVGSSITLKATVKPSTATQTVTWSTSNKAVATVTSAGKVTGVKAGTVTITAKSADGKKTATKKITVTAKATTPTTVEVTGVTVAPATASVAVGKTVTLTAKVTPSNATNQAIIWSSSDTTVATVANGVVTGVKAGTATITATTSNGKTATATITVTDGNTTTTPVEVTGVTLDPTTASVAVGATVPLTATVTPADATDKTITWSSSDTTVATVADGVVTGVKAGTATITATTSNGKTATAEITVKAEGSSDDSYSNTTDGNHQLSLDKNAKSYSISYGGSNNFVTTPSQLKEDVDTWKAKTNQIWDIDKLYDYLKDATTDTLNDSQILTSLLSGVYGVNATVEQISSAEEPEQVGEKETTIGYGWWNGSNQIGSGYEMTGDGTWSFDIPNGPAGAYMVEVIDKADEPTSYFTTTSQNDAWLALGWASDGNVSSVDASIGQNVAPWPEAGSTLRAVITREGNKVSVEYLANGARYAYAEATIVDLPETIYAHVYAQDGTYTYTFGKCTVSRTVKKVTVTKGSKTSVCDVEITKADTIDINVTGDQTFSISDIKVADETTSSAEHVITFTVTKGSFKGNFRAVIAKDGTSATLAYADNPAKALISYAETSTAYTLTIDGTFYSDIKGQTGNDYLSKLTIKNNY